MKKLAVFTLALLIVAAAPAFAGSVNSGDGPDSASTITISGSIELTGYVRTDGVNAVLDNPAGNGVGGALVDADDAADTDSAWTGQVKIRFDIGLAEKVSAAIELGNRDLRGNNHSANFAYFGDTEVSGMGLEVEVLKAYVRVDEFLYQQLSFQLGWQDFSLDLRGDGNSFLVDLTESEAAFVAPVQERYAGNVYAYGQANSAPFGWVSRERDNHAGGFRMTYNDEDTLYVDFFVFNVAEDDAAKLFTNSAAFDNHTDEYFYGFNLDYNLDTQGDRRSLVNAIFCVFSNNQNANRVYNLGLGVDYWWDNLELFGEIHGQFGDYASLESGDVSARGTAINGEKNSDQKAYGGYLGGKYLFESDWKPYLEISFWYLTGDDGQRDADNEDFVSYENVNDSLVLENSQFGLDVDSNYWAIKVKTGVTTSLQKPEDFDIALFFGHYQTTADVDRAGDFSADTPAHSNIDANLGDEVDLSATWRYSESLSFELKAGFLFNGDFWGNRPVTGGFGGFATGSDSMQIYTFTSDLKF